MGGCANGREGSCTSSPHAFLAAPKVCPARDTALDPHRPLITSYMHTIVQRRQRENLTSRCLACLRLRRLRRSASPSPPPLLVKDNNFVKSGDFNKISTHRTLHHRNLHAKILYSIRSVGRFGMKVSTFGYKITLMIVSFFSPKV